VPFGELRLVAVVSQGEPVTEGPLFASGEWMKWGLEIDEETFVAGGTNATLPFSLTSVPPWAAAGSRSPWDSSGYP